MTSVDSVQYRLRSSAFTNLRRFEPVLSFSVVLILAVAAYLLFSRQLGFYYNDWYPLASKVTGSSLETMFSADRPYLGSVYTITYGILGDNPFAWHLFAFLLRMAGAAGFFWLVRLLWPQQRAATMAMLAVFVLYPGFQQQPIALTFSNHLISYAMGLFSLALTVSAIKESHPVVRAVKVFLSAGLGAYVFLYEYMIGFEVMRLILLAFYSVRGSSRHWFRSAKRVLFRWLPYLPVPLIFLYWRIFRFQGERLTTRVDLLAEQYLTQPVQMVGRLMIETIRDFFETVLFAWGVPVYQSTAAVDLGTILVSLLIAIAGAGALALYLRWLRSGSLTTEPGNSSEIGWERGAIAFGAIAALMALLPVVFSGREVRYEYLMDRYTLHATYGVASLAVGCVYAIVRAPHRTAVIAVLVGLGLVAHYNNSIAYKEAWQIQREFWWQLSWRSPALKPDTVLIPLLPEAYRNQEGFEIWTQANAIYQREPGVFEIAGEILNEETAPEIAAGDSHFNVIRRFQFTIDYKNSLVASWPDDGSCLHVVDGAQVELSPSDDPLVWMVSKRSRTNLIDASSNQRQPPANIFGAEPDRGWCYYYQKASLARQQQNWSEVTRLGSEAVAEGLAPQNRMEWLPFIEGYLNTGEDQRAQELVTLVRENLGIKWMTCRSLSEGEGAYSSPAVYRQMVEMLCAK